MSATPLPGLTSPLPSLIVENLVVTNYASLPGGNTAGAAGAFVYSATGTENPAGFPVAIPGLPASYAAIAQASSSEGFVAATVTNQSGTGVTVATAAQLLDGDTVTVIFAPIV